MPTLRERGRRNRNSHNRWRVFGYVLGCISKCYDTMRVGQHYNKGGGDLVQRERGGEHYKAGEGNIKTRVIEISQRSRRATADLQLALCRWERRPLADSFYVVIHKYRLHIYVICKVEMYCLYLHAYISYERDSLVASSYSHSHDAGSGLQYLGTAIFWDEAHTNKYREPDLPVRRQGTGTMYHSAHRRRHSPMVHPTMISRLPCCSPHRGIVLQRTTHNSVCSQEYDVPLFSHFIFALNMLRVTSICERWDRQVYT